MKRVLLLAAACLVLVGCGKTHGSDVGPVASSTARTTVTATVTASATAGTLAPSQVLLTPFPTVNNPPPVRDPHLGPGIDPLKARTWPRPDNQLTPGEVKPGCTYPVTADRAVTAATLREVDSRYRYSGPFGILYVEFNHRVPHFACGSDGPDNINPERYDGVPVSRFVHNRADQLEGWVADQVRFGRWTLARAQQLFLGDWVSGWCAFYHDHSAETRRVDCAGVPALANGRG